MDQALQIHVLRRRQDSRDSKPRHGNPATFLVPEKSLIAPYSSGDCAGGDNDRREQVPPKPRSTFGGHHDKPGVDDLSFASIFREEQLSGSNMAGGEIPDYREQANSDPGIRDVVGIEYEQGADQRYGAQSAQWEQLCQW